ncbi:MAG TPA: amino acid permease [Clostridiaceae bacterium]|nr:amino acid permease [Clostridiaceae bacterium]
MNKKIGLLTLVMLIFVPTFGFGNITTNAYALGPAAIPSWIFVAAFYFLPLIIIIAELASANKDKGAGIYTWIESGLGTRWAYIGVWSYTFSNLFYLQMIFSRIPIMASWAIFGESRFDDSHTVLLSLLAAGVTIALTFIATRGVGFFSRISSFGGRFTVVATVVLVVFALIGYFLGQPAASAYTAQTVIPKLDAEYFSTFSWLLFAVAGVEAAGTYVNSIENPQKRLPKAIFIATALIAGAYILGSLAVSMLVSPEVLESGGIQNAPYIVYRTLAENFGLNGKIAIQVFATIFTITSIAAYVIWSESPLRAMFTDVPDGIFPKFLLKKQPDGTLRTALWVQCSLVVIMILAPMVGIRSINGIFVLLTNLTALSMIPPYIILIAAYLSYRLKKGETPLTIMKSRGGVILVSALTLTMSAFGFFGAGMYSFLYAESSSEALKGILMTYGGPIFFILLGYIPFYFSQRSAIRTDREVL